MVDASIDLPFGADIAFDAFSDLPRQPSWSSWLRSVSYINNDGSSSRGRSSSAAAAAKAGAAAAAAAVVVVVVVVVQTKGQTLSPETTPAEAQHKSGSRAKAQE